MDAGGSLEECIVDMVNSVEDGSHPSSRFPVPDYYKLVIFHAMARLTNLAKPY